MGYSTCNGHLCCDVCGGYAGKTIRSVTKRRCPFNWCPPPAVCNLCWETKKRAWKASHDTCKPAHERFKAECDREAALLAEGRYVRISACSTSKAIFSPDADLVHVIFRSKSGEIGRLMSTATYHALPMAMGVPLEEYIAAAESLNEPALVEAPANFY